MLRRIARQRRSDESGFTLIEIVVSIAILGFIIGPLAVSFISGVRATRASEDMLNRSRAARQIASFWTRDVHNVEPGGVNSQSTCPSKDGEAGIEEHLVTFSWGSGGNGAVPQSASWVLVGSGDNASLIRRACERGEPIVENVIAENFGVTGSQATDLVHGPSTSAPRTFCPVDNDGVGRTCTIVVSGSYSYSLTVDRRRPDRTNAGAASNVPGAPTVTVAEARNQRINVKWEDPILDSAQPAISGYRVHLYTDPLGEPIDSETVSSREYSFTGLTNTTSYWVAVQAQNAVGWGPVSEPFGPTIPDNATPEAPTVVSATPGDTSAVVRFTPNANDGGATVTAWHVYAEVDGAGQSIDATVPVSSVGGGQLEATLPGLLNGQSYKISVAGINSHGEGVRSARSDAIVPYGIPGRATITSVTPLSAGQVRVTWTAPTVAPVGAVDVTGGRPLLGYRVVVNSGGTGGPWPSASTYTNSLTYDTTGLQLGNTYTFAVQTYNARGYSESEPSGSAVPASPPSVPQNITAVVDGAGAVKVTWAAPASTNGAALSGYQLERDGVGGPATQNLSASTTTFTYTGLTVGNSYTFSVKARNSAGLGPAGVAARTVEGPPSVPTNVNVLRPSGSFGRSLALKWDAPSTGGSGVIYEYSCTGGGSPTPASVSGTSALTGERVVTGFKDGRSFTCQVRATNSYGSSSWAAMGSATPFGECTLSPVGSPNRDLYIEKSASNGRKIEDKYEIRRNDSAERWFFIKYDVRTGTCAESGTSISAIPANSVYIEGGRVYVKFRQRDNNNTRLCTTMAAYSEAWNDTTITWNDSASHASFYSGRSAAVFEANGSDIDLNSTSYAGIRTRLAEWYSTPGNNFGWVFAPTRTPGHCAGSPNTSNWIYYHSSRAAAAGDRPTMTVRFYSDGL